MIKTYSQNTRTSTKVISLVHSLSCVQLFATPWTAAHQASLSITNSWSLLKLMSIESVMPSNHLILCHPLLLPPSIFPSIRAFSNESVLCIRWPKYWSFSFSISPTPQFKSTETITILLIRYIDQTIVLYHYQFPDFGSHNIIIQKRVLVILEINAKVFSNCLSMFRHL